jgi:cytochrome c oxidase cbb3-type subunit 3
MTRAAILLALMLVACERERRTPPSPAHDDRPATASPNGTLVPGDQPIDGVVLDLALPGYAETAEAVANGKKLYAMFNCIGCHANGGGGMGVAFIDERWKYGSTPADVATSIVAGRPQGMPSYRGKVVPQQIYELTAYVRSLGGLVRTDAVSARSDHVQTIPQPTLRDLAIPKGSRATP